MKRIGISILNLGRVVALPLAGALLATPAIAQNASGDSALEEIIVISKSRGAVNVMDEPIAITAVTGAQIEASGIKDAFDLQQNVPGLLVSGSQTTTTSTFAVRGIGSTGNNFGVESSVGLYVDGVYRSRQSSMINELVDVEAIEVLRGPQGTLFGKNTAAGAINIRTVAPSTDGVDAFVDFTAGDYDLYRVSGAANIPLNDKFAFRGTFFSSNRDGYVDNYVYDLSAPSLSIQENVINDRDRWGVRAQLGYDNGDDLTMRVIADYSKIDEKCCAGTSRVDGLLAHDVLNATGVGVPGPDFLRMALGTIVFTDFPYPSVLPTAPVLGADTPLPPNVITGVSWDDYITSENFIPVSKNKDRGLSVEINKDFYSVKLTSVTAYRKFDTFDFIDADFTDTSIAERTNDADQHSISQELRLAGTFGDSSNWVVGGYYFAQKIRNNTRTVGGTQLQAFADLGQSALGQPTLSELTDAVTAISLATGGLIPQGAAAFPAGAFANDNVKQKHHGYAAFGQVDWAVTDEITLTLGARYTDETKDIDAIYTQTNPGTAVPDLTGIGTAIFLFQQWAGGGMVGPPPDLTPLLAVAQPNEGWAAWTLAPFSPRPNVSETLKDDQITGTAKVTWYPNETMMLYASYGRGFKSGGTNTDRIWFFLPQLFDAEKSDSYEIGFKSDLTNNLRITAAIYQTDFDDFQANTFTGTGFYLQNAGDLRVKGAELEFVWNPFANTSVAGYYAHNDGEYKTFLEGVCWDATPFHTGVDDPGRLPAPPGVDPNEVPCDRSGDDLPYNPEDRFNLSFTQNFPMENSNLFVRAEYSWMSDQTTDGDNDPLTRQDSFGILNLRVGVDIDDWNSTITLWGRNVTDERYYLGSFDPPLLDFGRMNSYPAEPQTYGITFRKNWD